MYYKVKFTTTAGVEREWPINAAYRHESEAQAKQAELRRRGMTNVRVVTQFSNPSGRTMLIEPDQFMY